MVKVKYLFNNPFTELLSSTPLFLICVILISVQSCIGEDVIDDFVEAQIRIDNPISEIQVNTQYTYEATYFNNIGLPENIQIQWESSDDNVISIDENGTATAISAGTATISASVESEHGLIKDDDSLTVTKEEIITESEDSKQGTIITTSSYRLEGSFTITTVDDDLLLHIAEDYVASNSLPGLYLYLTNNPNSVNGALEVGEVEVFNGEHNYTIPDTGLNDYSYLLYWCKPFAVKVGEGEIEE